MTRDNYVAPRTSRASQGHAVHSTRFDSGFCARTSIREFERKIIQYHQGLETGRLVRCGLVAEQTLLEQYRTEPALAS
jgi:hypothetical protein